MHEGVFRPPWPMCGFESTSIDGAGLAARLESIGRCTAEPVLRGPGCSGPAIVENKMRSTNASAGPERVADYCLHGWLCSVALHLSVR
eukprot:1502724-Alexandrium_andersonii.AAC.1